MASNLAVRRLYKIPPNLRTPARLAVAGVVFGLAYNVATADAGEKLGTALGGVVRSSRAIYAIGFVVLDYKYSLASLRPNSNEYRMKISEVHLRSAKRFLKLCEANKGFYVKAGQFVSSLRQVPKEYTSTLSCLQDQATPCDFKIVQKVLVNNLGKNLSDVFLEFDEQPIAAASIAQVHRARLKDSREVAVKVQYPGLEQRMKIDITTMTVMSQLVAWIFPNYRFERIVSEFERTMSLELDFLQEAKNSERTARNFRRNNFIIVPQVFWDLTTSQVLTMQFCAGHKVDDVDFLRTSGIDPKKVAKALMEIFAEMIFVHGFVHGDPHPGNILVLEGGPMGFSIGTHLSVYQYIIEVLASCFVPSCLIYEELYATAAILDHGIYRELDDEFRLDYCELWKALILLDSKKIQDLGEKFGVGKYAKYFPVIFTGRTLESKSALGSQMSAQEKKLLKQEIRSLKIDDITLFMESLPSDFLTILRTDGLLRSIIGKLGAPRRTRLLAYAKYALYGLERHAELHHGSLVKYAVSRMKGNISYLQIRVALEILALFSQMEEALQSFVIELKTRLQMVVDFYNGTMISSIFKLQAKAM